MKKALYILVIGTFLAGASLSYSAPAGKHAAYKGSEPSTFAQKNPPVVATLATALRL